jgi:hypothetical protein
MYLLTNLTIDSAEVDVIDSVFLADLIKVEALEDK